MLRRLLGKVDDGRFGRALAGMQAGWRWECDRRVYSTGEDRQLEHVAGVVSYGSKKYTVRIKRQGRRYTARCGCDDAVRRGVLCKHIAFAAMSELAAAAAARSAHRQLPELG